MVIQPVVCVNQLLVPPSSTLTSHGRERLGRQQQTNTQRVGVLRCYYTLSGTDIVAALASHVKGNSLLKTAAVDLDVEKEEVFWANSWPLLSRT